MGRLALSTCLLLPLLGTSFAVASDEPVADVVAWATSDNTLHVRWTTVVPAVSRVEYGPTDALGGIAEEDLSSLRGTTNNRDSGQGFANNHRADIPGIETWPVHLRITGMTRDGVAFASASFTAGASPEPRGAVRRSRIPLRIHQGGWTLQALPITVGIPFPSGALDAPDHVRLLADGEEAPCQAVADQYTYLRLSPDQATGLATADVPAAGQYTLWAKVAANARLEGLQVNGIGVAPARPSPEATWLPLGRLELPAGRVAIANVPPPPAVALLVLTDDPSSSLQPNAP